ncbi:hypothetical protein [Streptomyces sp. NBC_00328]|uniref:hypothetical protein n=1 Tax=Streptomyces sp. NBC_00328 TaxID=2903646 RepID=UPI002E2829C5|nr:hypothetical protein [Streptomyces sp. NBC_00328]
MVKRVRTLSAGLSVGVAALAATVLATTPAAAALHSLSWHVSKSQTYCNSLPQHTGVQQMKKAACDSQVITLHQMAVSQAISRGMSEAAVAAGMNWPGPGH